MPSFLELLRNIYVQLDDPLLFNFYSFRGYRSIFIIYYVCDNHGLRILICLLRFINIIKGVGLPNRFLNGKIICIICSKIFSTTNANHVLFFILYQRRMQKSFIFCSLYIIYTCRGIKILKNLHTLNYI